MNKLRLSMYLCTPSGTKSKDVALLLLSLSILHYFSKVPKRGGCKTILFCNTLQSGFRKTVHLSGKAIYTEKYHDNSRQHCGKPAAASAQPFEFAAYIYSDT